jgi:hypothetical protein
MVWRRDLPFSERGCFSQVDQSKVQDQMVERRVALESSGASTQAEGTSCSFYIYGYGLHN